MNGTLGTLNLMIGLAMGLNLLALGSSRLPSLIRAMSVQGMLLGVMPLLMEHERLDWRILLVAAATIAGKGVVIPRPAAAGHARGQHRTGDRTVHRFRPVAPARSRRHHHGRGIGAGLAIVA